jgi:CDP-glycerol glycerophosphotransferase
VLRRSFRWSGPIAETGLPRTDPLLAPDRDAHAAAVRAALGVPPGHRVILHAPTRRDDQAHDGEHHRMPPLPDPALLRRALGRSATVLLHSHPTVADRLTGGGAGGDLFRDVSGYGDTAGLLLAADVLVTDYASLTADFTATGRPVLFHLPDLDHVRDTLRGLTHDLPTLTPGPVLRTDADLADALSATLRDPEATTRAHASAYAAYRARFCPLDDGRASARAVDRLLAAGPAGAAARSAAPEPPPERIAAR